jgi:CRP-like cAMP-binding protein
MTESDFRRLIEIDPEIRLRVLGSMSDRLEGVTP